MGNLFFTFLTQPLANGLALFYHLLGSNLGIAIIAFSLFLRFLLNPLTKPYMDSMSKMKDLAPELNRLKKKHGNDKTAYAKAQAEFYKTKGINPGAGCLPYILQIVVLIAFFNVFNKILTGDNVTAKFNEILYPALKFGEGVIVNTRFLYLDLAKPDTFLVSGIPFKLPGLFLLASAIVQFVSSKMMAPVISQEEKEAKKTKSETDDMQVAMQSSMAYTFPLMTIIFGINFPSGLALYWLVFSLFQVWQQYQSSGWGGLAPVKSRLTPLIARVGLVKSREGEGK